MFSNSYYRRRVFITGHTGFKGSWLALWLKHLGAEVTGFSLAPESTPNHWSLLDLDITDVRGDVRDLPLLQTKMQQAAPDIVFHLAAQPLVRRSYRDPIETWSTNVMGTANVLEACRHSDSVRAVVIVTTDKCYENLEQVWGYRESDRLGGHDPYSASKAAAELVVASYRKSFWKNAVPLVATARAGNVIGGGDWSEDRLIPDSVRATERNESLEIRSPQATRPWQHVLESLSGYLLLGQRLLAGESKFSDAWNFGPSYEGNQTVSFVLSEIQSYWPKLLWHVTDQEQPHETTLLQLDSSRARRLLGWLPVWELEQTLQKTAEWYRAFLGSGELISAKQLMDYTADAQRNSLPWASKDNFPT